jgi:hypothetical protein
VSRGVAHLLCGLFPWVVLLCFASCVLDVVAETQERRARETKAINDFRPLLNDNKLENAAGWRHRRYEYFQQTKIQGLWRSDAEYRGFYTEHPRSYPVKGMTSYEEERARAQGACMEVGLPDESGWYCPRCGLKMRFKPERASDRLVHRALVIDALRTIGLDPEGA